jgi:hypothetical protein
VEQSTWNDWQFEKLARRLEARVDRLEVDLREERSREEWRRKSERFRVQSNLLVAGAYLAAAISVVLAVLSNV